MNNLHIITKSNDLIEARFKLSLNQQRLILFLISIIKPDDDDFNDYELRASEFAEMFGIECDNDMKVTIEDAARGLVGRELNLSIGEEMEYVTWLSYAKYIKNKGFIVIRFDKSLKPYLLQLKSQFTQYRLLCVVKFKSLYSIRLYEILKSYEYLGNGKGFYREISIAELKLFFGIEEGSYEKISHFKSRIIEPSVNEINQHSDIFVSSVEYIKEGRSFVNIKFSVEPKDNAFDKKPLVLVCDSLNVYTLLRDFGIAEQTIQKWIKDYGNETILNACKYVRAKQADGKVKDVPAYLAKTLKEGYYVAWMEEDRKKEEKRALVLAQKAEKEEKEQMEREEARRRVDAILEAFHALPTVEQIGYRTIFSTSGNPVITKMWKKAAAVDPTPENDPKFRFSFADFLQNYQPPS